MENTESGPDPCRKNNLYATVTHAMNNRLQGFGAFLFELQEGKWPEEEIDSVQSVLNNADRACGVVDDLIDGRRVRNLIVSISIDDVVEYAEYAADTIRYTHQNIKYAPRRIRRAYHHRR